jgi:type IV secretory pathway TraG/TraD family ATPase VirD4
VTLVRDLDIAFVFGVQSFSQFAAVYGQEDTKTITDNCLTWFVLPGLRPNTAEEVSRALGERTALGASDGTSSTSSGGWFGHASHSESSNQTERARRLLTADEVRRLPLDRAIVLHNNRYPILVRRHHSTLESDPPAPVAPCGNVIAEEFRQL